MIVPYRPGVDDVLSTQGVSPLYTTMTMTMWVRAFSPNTEWRTVAGKGDRAFSMRLDSDEATTHENFNFGQSSYWALGQPADAEGWTLLPCGSAIRNVPGGVVMAVAFAETVFIPACKVAHFDLVKE